jgi:hypothetical protein
LIRGELTYVRKLTDAENLKIDRIFKARRIPAVGTPTYDVLHIINGVGPYRNKPHIECGEGHVLLALLGLGYEVCDVEEVAAAGFKLAFNNSDLFPYALRAPYRLLEEAERKRYANRDKPEHSTARDAQPQESEEN